MVAVDTINSSVEALKKLTGPFSEQPGIRNLQRELLIKQLSQFAIGFQTMPVKVSTDDGQYQAWKNITVTAYNNIKDALQHTQPSNIMLRNINALAEYGDKALNLALKDVQAERGISRRMSA